MRAPETLSHFHQEAFPQVGRCASQHQAHDTTSDTGAQHTQFPQLVQVLCCEYHGPSMWDADAR
eukprot:2424521-Amphidinium_carterae.1